MSSLSLSFTASSERHAMVVQVGDLCGSDRRVGDAPTNAHIRPSRSRGQTWARARLPGTELRARLRRSLRTRGLRRAWEIFRQGPKPANRRVVQIRSKIETLESRGVAQPGSAPALGREPAESWPALSCDPANSSENSNTSQQVIRHKSPHGTAAHHQKCHAECHTSCSSEGTRAPDFQGINPTWLQDGPTFTSCEHEGAAAAGHRTPRD